MKLRIFTLILAAAAGFALNACTSNQNTAHQKETFFGLYTYEPACYAPTSSTALVGRTDSVMGMELPSGDRTQFLWGLVSVEDY